MDIQIASDKTMLNSKLGIFQRAWSTLFSPKEYFTSIKDEGDFKTPLIFYIAFVFVPVLVINIASAYLANALIFSKMAITITSNVISYFSIIAAIHLFVSLSGGKEGFLNTLKAVIYPSIFLIPLLLISVISLLIPSLYLLFALIAFGITLYGLQLELWAFEILQNIGPWRAFFAISLALATLSTVIRFLR